MTIQTQLREIVASFGLAPDDQIDPLEIAANRIDELEAVVRELVTIEHRPSRVAIANKALEEPAA